MAYPYGMKYSTLTFSQPLAVSGKEADRTDITITPTQYVVWEDTGQPIEDFTDTVSAPAGEPGEVTAPFVDQEGFRNRMGELVTGFAYKVVRRAWYGSQIRTASRTWAPLVGQETVDFDTLPADEPNEPYTVQAPEVLSVAGATGAVGVDFLAERLTPWVDARIEAGSNLDDLLPTVEAAVLDPTSDLRAAVDSRATAAATAAAAPKLNSSAKGAASGVAPLDTSAKVPDTNLPTRLGTTALNSAYAAKSVETSKLDATAVGAANGVAPLGNDSKLLENVLPTRLGDAALAATFLPRWSPARAYVTGDRVLSPAGLPVTARTTFTSGATYNPANWWLVHSDTLFVTAAELTGLADSTPSLRAASDYCIANGVKRIQLPPGAFDYRSRWYLNLGTSVGLEVIGHGESTVFRHTGGTADLAFIHALGTDDAKVATTVDIPAGSRSATFPAAVASTLSKGDVVGLESTLYAFDVNNEAGMRGYASELRFVSAVSGTTVTFAGPTIWPYNTADSAVVWKMNPVNGVKLRNFVITSSDPLVNKWKGIQISKAADVELSGITLRDAGGGIYLYDCLDARVVDLNADRLPNYGNYLGYGCAVAGRSANVLIDRPRGRGTRHIITTLSDERNGVHWGGPRQVTVRDGVGEAFPGSFSVWDTHPHGYDVTFENCHASGGVAGQGDSCGFQIRSLKTQIINGVTQNMGAGGVRVHSMALNTDIIGGEFSHSQTFGVTVSGDTRIKGAWIHHNGASGVILGTRATKAHVTGCRIEDNAQLSTGYGIHDQTTTADGKNVVGPGNIIPKGTAQTIGMLSPKNDLVFYGNVMRGYGAGLDGVGGTITGGVVRAQNITD